MTDGSWLVVYGPKSNTDSCDYYGRLCEDVHRGRMNDAKLRPNSNNSEFISNWLKDDVAAYDGVVEKWAEKDTDVKDEVSGEVNLFGE